MAKLRLRLKAKKCDSAPTRYDVENIPSQFSVEMKNKFELLLRNDEEGQTPNELWEDMKETVKNAAKNHIPKKRKRKQPWISNQTFDIADDRKRAKAKHNRGEWTRLNKEVTSSVKEDKRNYIEGKCEDLERHKNNSKAAFAIVKEITKKRIPRLDVIYDGNGKTLTENEDIKDRWVQYCTKLFATQEQVDTQWEESNKMEPPPLRSEVELAMQQLKDGKSPGFDNLTSEMWKATGEEGIDLMWHLSCKICNGREWPKDWCRAVFIPLPKKGDLKECANHRTISLICHASKILLKVISRRMKIKLQAEISDEQAGFREGRGTREQIVNIRNIIEKCREHRHPLYLCFIDYSKAFDCVSHSQLWNTMAKMGFPSHIIELIKNLYHDQEATVRTSNGNTEWFGIGRGVRQGCILSPNLLNIY